MTARIGTPDEELKGIDTTRLSTRTLETFSRFASILAGEKIRIYSGKFPTAAFDVKNRVIFLPELDGVSMKVYEMFLAHEVSHGLYTPGGEHGAKEMQASAAEICPEHPELGFMYINVTEDARIEKLLCRKFPGAKKILLMGYTDIYEQDILKFISTYRERAESGDLMLIDRINCRAKFGEFFPVEFTDEEKPFMDRAYYTETFEDVVQLAKDIFEFSKQKEQEKLQKQMEQLAKSKEEMEAMKKALEEAIKNGNIKFGKGKGGQPGGTEIELSDELLEGLSDEAKEALKKLLEEHYNNLTPVTEKHMNEKMEKHVSSGSSKGNLDKAKKEVQDKADKQTGNEASTTELRAFEDKKDLLRKKMASRSNYSPHRGFRN